MRTLFVVVVTLFAFACSDDGEGPTGEKAVTDGPTPTGDSVLPWPDSFQI